MHSTTFFGWDLPTWERAFRWADVPFAHPMSNHRATIEIMDRWRDSGGPICGPSGRILMETTDEPG